jgi:hypothetical protein
MLAGDYQGVWASVASVTMIRNCDCCVWVLTCMHAFMHDQISVSLLPTRMITSCSISTFMHEYVHTYIHSYIYSYMHACMHTHTKTHPYIYIYIYIYTYIHTIQYYTRQDKTREYIQYIEYIQCVPCMRCMQYMQYTHAYKTVSRAMMTWFLSDAAPKRLTAPCFMHTHTNKCMHASATVWFHSPWCRANEAHYAVFCVSGAHGRLRVREVRDLTTRLLRDRSQLLCIF